MTAIDLKTALESGGMTALVAILLTFILRTLASRLHTIDENQKRTNRLLTRVLRELGVSYNGDD